MRLLVIALLVLGSLAAVRAEDACRTGASALADEHALAAVRAACDCDGAANRRSWRRCARAAIETALGDGSLRTACRRTARLDADLATCGTSRVTCGRESDDGGSCRVTTPGACRGRRRTACEAFTHCSDVTEWTAGTCDDPRAAGPYGVGVRTVRLTKDSVASPGTTRTLDVIVWYPTTPGAGPFDNVLKGATDAPLVTDGAPWPLVMFSHGSCGYAAQSTFLMTALASRGYVVASTPHPGNQIYEFPTCGTGPAQSASFQERPADVTFTLDFMLAATADPASPFFGAIDPDRVGMMGHSFGGLTTFLTATTDPRYKVAVPLAPATPGKPVLRIPTLMALGAIDSVVNNTLTEAAYDVATAPRMLVAIGNAGHFAFSDGCFPGKDCNPPVTRTQPEAHALALRYIVPFLEVYLAGRPEAAALLGAAVPDVRVRDDR
jgi:predicted dienelactone hydrolase